MSSPARLFGTDGIRAPFGVPPLDRRTISALALALGAKLRREAAKGDAPPFVVLGGDTRASTPETCSWIAAGLEAQGIETRFAGEIPTPGVAYLARRLGATCGVAVSASHNPVPDNGVKLIDGGGFKWPEEAEAELERQLLALRDAPTFEPTPSRVLQVETGLAADYLRSLEGSVPSGAPFRGLKVSIDCGHGAASRFAAELFSDLGAEVTVLHAEPNGTNINADGGSTHPQAVAAKVLETRSDLGIAFDGDADRCILVDERGEVRDGDAILYLWARDLAARSELPHGKVVATSMSNLGLVRALAREGIQVVRCDVGDRAVVATMKEEGIVLGGEQSGHIVLLGLASSGDGMSTAVQMVAIGARSDKAMSELLS